MVLISYYSVVFFFSLIIVAAFWGWKIDSKRRFIFTPFVVFLLNDIIFTWPIGLLFSNEREIISSITPFVASFSATMSFIAGYLGLTLSTNKQPGLEIDKFFRKPVLVPATDLKLYTLLAILIVLGTAIGVYYYRGIPPTIKAIVEMAKGSELSDVQSIVSSGRSELTKSHYFGGQYRGQGVCKKFMFVIWIYCLGLCCISGFRKQSKSYWGLAILMFALSFFYIGGTGERGPFLYGLFIVIIALSFQVNLTLKRVLSLGIGMLCFFVLITTLSPRYKTSGFGLPLIKKAAGSVVHRISSGNKINNVRIVNFIEEGQLSYMYGANHLRMAINVIPGVHVLPLAHEIGRKVKGEGYTTYFSPTYLGNVYVDFGIMGVFIIYFFMGALMQQLFLIPLRMRKRPENIMFLAFFVYNLGIMSAGAGIISFMSGMIPVFFVQFICIVNRSLLSYRVDDKKKSRNCI